MNSNLRSGKTDRIWAKKKYKIKFIFKWEEHIESYRTEWNPVHTELNEIGKLQNKSNQT